MFVILLLTAIIVLFPVVAIAIRNAVPLAAAQRYFIRSLPFFLIHNLFYAWGYSLKGDLADYLIFLSEYMSVVLLIALCRRWRNNWYTKVISWTGGIIAVLLVLISPLLFLGLTSSSFKPYKQFTFYSAKKCYHSRLYMEGFATSYSTRFTFKTYRHYKYLPFENQIDYTSFLDTEAGEYPDGDISIYIDEETTPRSLIFRWPSGKEMTKPIQ